MTYTRLHRINAGGQGEVWAAAGDDGSQVAIKYMHLAGSAAQQDEDLRRFKREITCQSSLSHPGVLPIIAMNLANTEPFFVMPIADESLRDLLVRNPHGLAEAEAVRIFAGIVDAVAYAHSEGVVHRDLKPENVLLMNNDPVLSDFGLGRRMFSGSTTLTMANVGWGSYAYSAPEQFTDLHGVDASADVFALGRVFYELLTGQVAASGIDYALVPGQYRYIIMTAVQQQPERRFSSAVELQRELSLLASANESGLLRAPAEHGATLIAAIAAGDRSKVAELGRLLIDNSEDVQLYMQVLVQTPEAVLTAFALGGPVEFKEAMRIFDGYADGGHPWSFTDTLADFMQAAFRATSDIETRTMLLERLLLLGYSHNRWYVRSRFVEVAREALGDPAYVPIVARMLREHPEARDFIRGGFEGVSLPAVVADALAA
ncbi:serine/threonine-protein kinase [Agromyces sp. SYSU T00266]|uniref:serine/threonine-protein kinase n=1 Tax=Agromyces zhanjiangensis TaxID=3158562 RepID=UPI003398FE78